MRRTSSRHDRLLARHRRIPAVLSPSPGRVAAITGAAWRGGSANTARGAANFTAEAIGTARATGCAGLVVARMDSGYYNAAVCQAARRAGGGTAFTSKKGQAITARLIVRRVRDLGPRAAEGTDELFPLWRCCPVFTGSPFTMLQGEAQHRDHAIIEQIFADWTNGPLAHMPSGKFTANAAWLTLAANTHNLLRTAGCLVSPHHAQACGATMRTDLIAVAARPPGAAAAT